MRKLFSVLVLVCLYFSDDALAQKFSRFKPIRIPDRDEGEPPRGSSPPLRASPRRVEQHERLSSLPGKYKSKDEVFSDIKRLRSFLAEVEEDKRASAEPVKKERPAMSSKPPAKRVFFRQPTGSVQVEPASENERTVSAVDEGFSAFPAREAGPRESRRPVSLDDDEAPVLRSRENYRSRQEPVQRDEIPAPRPAPRTTPRPKTPMIKGFKVKGDHTNRVIFLDVAELDFDPASGSLNLGDSELVPVDEAADSLPGFDVPPPRQTPSYDRLPQQSYDRFPQQQQETRGYDRYAQPEPEYRPIAPDFREQSYTPRRQQPQTPRQQPSQFFLKFDGQAPEPALPQRAQQSLPTPDSRFDSLRSSPLTQQQQGQFSSFPVRGNQDAYQLPELEQPAYQLPRQQQQQVQDFDQPAYNLPREQQTYDRQAYQLPQQTRPFEDEEALLKTEDRSGYDVYLRGVLEQTRQIAQARKLADDIGNLNLRTEADRIARLPPQQRNRYQQQQQQYQQQQFQQQQYEQPQQFQQRQFQQPLQQQFQQPLQQPQQDQLPKVPGLEDVLRQQNEVIALQQQFDSQYNQNLQPQPQQQQYQQPQQQQYQQPQFQQPQFQPQIQQQQFQNQPKVPGLEQLQQQRQALLAIELNHDASLHQQPQQNFQQPQQHFQQPQQHFQQPQQYQAPQQQQPNSIPGLDQHARYVAELQAAQTALGTLQG